MAVCAYLYTISRYGYPPPAEDTPRHLEEMASLGFREVELEGIREEHLRAMHARRHDTRARLESLGLTLPVFCAVLPALASPDPSARRHALGLFALGCETAVALGASALLDNGPLPPFRFPAFLPPARHFDDDALPQAWLPPELDWPAYWEDLAHTYRTACDLAADHGLAFHLHPCAGALAASADGFLLFSAAVARPNLRFNFDTANQFFLRENLVLAWRRLHPFVDYIHLSDTSLTRHQHLPPGQGSIPWERFFAALRQTGFPGRFGFDIGGAETPLPDLAQAYRDAASWLHARGWA